MKNIFCLFLAFSATICLWAQANVSTSAKAVGPTPIQRNGLRQRQFQRVSKRSRIEAQVERVGKRLDLSETQRLDLRKILESQQAQSNRLWGDQKIPALDRMTQLRALQENTRNQFRAILSREQRQQYDDLLQQQESRQNAAQASDKTAR
jgi:hypothetical protein